ncbi:protein [Lentinula edodes]|uniref:Protein n=1 Tax=Lentinula edodes TaxID=5353 RepID=A0A1Q3EPZ4_LENED|nr:protein [Lentinula edodes]
MYQRRGFIMLGWNVQKSTISTILCSSTAGGAGSSQASARERTPVLPLHGRLQLTKIFIKRVKHRDTVSSGSNMPSDEEQTKNVKRRSGKEEFFPALSGATNLTLSALRDAAALAPIPYLGEAASLAIDIWDAVQSTRDTKASLKSLGSDAISLVYAVMATCDEVLKRHRQQESAESTVEDTQKLEKENSQIDEEVNKDRDPSKPEQTKKEEEINPELRHNLERLCRHVASRNAFIRFLTVRSDTGKVTEFQNKMKMALDLFTLQSNITLRQVTGRIEAQQTQVLQTLQSPVSPTSEGANIFTSLSTPPATGPPASGEAPTSPIATESPHTLPGNASASVFPAIFSFAGATFRTGDIPVRHTTPTSEEGKGKGVVEQHGEESGAATVGSSEPMNEPEHAAPARNPIASSGAINFTSISGDQNTSWVNDQSRRWNYGNIYNADEGPRLGNNRRTNGGGPSTRRDQREEHGNQRGSDRVEDDEYDDEVRFGRQLNRFVASQPRGNLADETHEWDKGYDSHDVPVVSMNNRPQIGFIPPQTYYDENGVPTAIPRGRGKSGRRWRNERDHWDSYGGGRGGDYRYL